MQGAVAFNHHLCVQRSQIDFLVNRLHGTNTPDGHKVASVDDKTVDWNDWAKDFYPKDTPTWQDKCAAVEKTDAVFNDAVTVLSAYAKALSTVASDDYSGNDIGGVVTDVDNLLAGIPGTAGTVGAGLKPLGSSNGQPGAIGQVGGAIKESYAAHQVSGIVKNADPGGERKERHA